MHWVSFATPVAATAAYIGDSAGGRHRYINPFGAALRLFFSTENRFLPPWSVEELNAACLSSRTPPRSGQR
jgi:hypothetical protein